MEHDELDDILDTVLRKRANAASIKIDGDRVTHSSAPPEIAFLAGLAAMRIGAPPGVHTEAWTSKRLREIRNGARLILEARLKEQDDETI
mgnify:CR=1 FL=1